MDKSKIKIYLLNSLVLFNKFLPYLLTAFSLKLFQIVDSACTFTIGSTVIVALTTFESLRIIVGTFNSAINNGFILSFSKSANKRDLKDKSISELISSYFSTLVVLRN